MKLFVESLGPAVRYDLLLADNSPADPVGFVEPPQPHRRDELRGELPVEETGPLLERAARPAPQCLGREEEVKVLLLELACRLCSLVAKFKLEERQETNWFKQGRP